MNKHYHLIGIGGIGMSGIAQLLLRRGLSVSGSDLKESKIIEELKALGAKVFIGHNPRNIEGADTVVYSSAVKEDNPEIVEAKRLKLTLLKRAVALVELMKDKVVIAVTGSHGKTTTTSLVSYLLLEAKMMPTVAIGGILRNIDCNALLGDGKFFIAEADESDGTFLYFSPNYSIITNVDYEHLDYYKDFDSVKGAFREFMNRTQKDGCIFCCDDDTHIKEILKDYKHRYLLFGLTERAHIYPKNIYMKGLTSEFDCFYNNKFVDRFYLSLGGVHNITNALSVIALGIELGIGLELIKSILANFKGTKRRLEVKFYDTYLVIDDYAHHPTEIKATLAALKDLKSNRVIAVFQPHRYTRTKLLMDEFGKSFDLADHIIVTDIYPAGEASVEGISARCIYDRIKKYSPHKQIEYLPKKELVKRILEIIKPDDLIITLGAGDITRTCDELVEELKK